jgi:archaellum component FlaD/FlaE
MGDQAGGSGPAGGPREGLQTFTVQPEPGPNPVIPPKEPREATPAVQSLSQSSKVDEKKVSSNNVGAVNEQLEDLSDNLKNLVYDFRSFMSEAGSPFNPNDIPATRPDSKEAQAAQAVSAQVEGPGYISAETAGAEERETIEAPSEIDSEFTEKHIPAKEKLRLVELLEQPRKKSSALSHLGQAISASRRGGKFSYDLKSNLDSADMPALIRAVNSTDYLLHAVGRKNLLKILEVGTREGWIRPEVERMVLSVTEVLSTAGAECDDRVINVSDLLRVVYFLNRLLDPETSDLLTMNAPAFPRNVR